MSEKRTPWGFNGSWAALHLSVVTQNLPLPSPHSCEEDKLFDALGITKSHRKLLRAIAMFTILILVISRIRISKRINLCFLDMWNLLCINYTSILFFKTTVMCNFTPIILAKFSHLDHVHRWQGRGEAGFSKKLFQFTLPPSVSKRLPSLHTPPR